MVEEPAGPPPSVATPSYADRPNRSYVTRRTYDRAGDTVTLTCMGGPEFPTEEQSYDRAAPFLGALLQALDDEARPFAQPARPPGLPYDFHWHGLMGYNDSGLRVVGANPRHQRLLSITSAATASASCRRSMVDTA